MAIGDFNAVFHSSHCVNGNDVFEAETVDGYFYRVKWSRVCQIQWPCLLLGKKGSGEGRILSRIDHCVANSLWLTKYLNVRVKYLNLGLSDHSSMVLEVHDRQEGGQRPFRSWTTLHFILIS